MTETKTGIIEQMATELFARERAAMNAVLDQVVLRCGTRQWRRYRDEEYQQCLTLETPSGLWYALETPSHREWLVYEEAHGSWFDAQLIQSYQALPDAVGYLVRRELAHALQEWN